MSREVSHRPRTERHTSLYDITTPTPGARSRGRSLSTRKAGMVNTSVHSPHSSIETRMFVPSRSETPNRPTSGLISRK